MEGSDGDSWEDRTGSRRRGLYRECNSIHPDAYHAYHDIISHSDSGDGKKRAALAKLLVFLLLTSPYEDRFFFTKVPRIFEACAEDEVDFDVEKAEKAFHELERYILLIARSPWKQELRQIKLYSGFFKVQVESRLSRAVDVLAIIGFENKSPGWIQLRTPVNVDLCYKVAFDMFVASVECKVLSTAFRQLLPIGFLRVDIVKGRRYVQGNVESLKNWLEQNCKPVSRHPWQKSFDSDRGVENIVELPIRQHKLAEFAPAKAYNKDSPKLLGGYRNKRTDSGYSSAVGVSVRPRASKTVPFRLTPDNYDTPSAQNTTCYDEGTIDDHLAAASLMTLNQGPSKPGLKGSVPLGEYEPRAGAEWNYVRDGLLQKYGKSYFQGERGDILADRRPVSSYEEKQERGVDIEALDTERNQAPTLPPRQGRNLSKSGYQSGKPSYTPRFDPRPSVRHPPPLVARGSKPGVGLSQVSDNVCDGLPDSEDQPLSADRPRQRPQPDVLSTDGAQAAALKSAFFKDKLQDYERLDQQLSYPGELPDLEHNPSMQSSSTWSCGSCTFRNQLSDTVCSMCGKSSRSSPKPREERPVRVCNDCTFENPTTAKFCEVCDRCLDSCETEV